MPSLITRVLALLAIALLPLPAFAASDTATIVASAKTALAIPGVETKGNRLTAVHFWAIWCVPCLKELPQLDAVAAAYRDKGFQVAAVSLDTDVRKVESFFAGKGISTLKPVIDTNNAAFLAAKLRGLPGTLFFNTDGELIARADGPLDWNAKTTIDFIEGLHP